MRWQVLVVGPTDKSVDPAVAALRRVGVDFTYEHACSRAALLTALGKSEIDVVIFDAAVDHVPLDFVYTHAPAAAVVPFTTTEEMADDLARLVSARTDLEE